MHPCYIQGYETAEKFIPVAVELRLRSQNFVSCQPRANTAAIWQQASPFPNIHSIYFALVLSTISGVSRVVQTRLTNRPASVASTFTSKNIFPDEFCSVLALETRYCIDSARHLIGYRKKNIFGLVYRTELLYKTRYSSPKIQIPLTGTKFIF